MTHKNNHLSVNRRTLLTVGTGLGVAAAAPTAALALSTPKEGLEHQILDLIQDLESDHGSGLAAINWSRRHIANKLRVALDLQVAAPSFDDDYQEFYKKTL